MSGTLADRLSGRRFAIDTAPVIYFIQGNAKYATLVRSVFELVHARQAQAFTSVITLTEVLIHPLRQNRNDLAEEYRDILTCTPGLTVFDIDHDIAALAARVRSETGLKIPDAYQIATGVHHQATALVTNDRDLARFKDLEVLTLDDFVQVDGESGSNR